MCALISYLLAFLIVALFLVAALLADYLDRR